MGSSVSRSMKPARRGGTTVERRQRVPGTAAIVGLFVYSNRDVEEKGCRPEWFRVGASDSALRCHPLPEVVERLPRCCRARPQPAVEDGDRRTSAGGHFRERPLSYHTLARKYRARGAPPTTGPRAAPGRRPISIRRARSASDRFVEVLPSASGCAFSISRPEDRAASPAAGGAARPRGRRTDWEIGRREAVSDPPR